MVFAQARHAIAAATLAAVFALTIGCPTVVADARPCGSASSVRATAEAITALGPRRDSSPAADSAARLINDRLVALGLSPNREIIGVQTVPRIAIGSHVIKPTRVVNSSSENIWVRFGGDAPARLLVAHYDTVAGSPGAADNATAVAILLELAACFAIELPPAPVVIAFTGAEEIGLVGARTLARTLAGQLELAVSLDLIGHQKELAINGLSSVWTKERLSWLAARVEATDAEATAPPFHRLVSRRLPQLERSDHRAFAIAGVPSLHFYGRSRERIYLAYHTPFDTMDRIEDGAITNALALAHEIVTAHDPLPAKSSDLGVWVSTPIGPLVLSGYAVLAAEIVTAIIAGVLLMLCWARRRLAIRERAVGVAATLLVFAAAFLVVALAGYARAIVHQNDLAAFHHPLRTVIASLALATAIAGLLAMLINRRGFFIRGTRYHSLAALVPLVIGVALLGFGLVEIAWVPLVAAAMFALAGFALDRPIVCTLATAVGVIVSLFALLSPGLIREAIFQGFYPEKVPLTAFVALVSLPSFLAVVGAIRARLAEPARGVAIALSCALVFAAVVAAAIIIVPAPPCSQAAAQAYGLACELPEISALGK